MKSWRVTVQATGRRHRAQRYAYVVHRNGFLQFVSRYRYHSPESARRAGEEDANEYDALEAQ